VHLAATQRQVVHHLHTSWPRLAIVRNRQAFDLRAPRISASQKVELSGRLSVELSQRCFLAATCSAELREECDEKTLVALVAQEQWVGN